MLFWLIGCATPGADMARVEALERRLDAVESELQDLRGSEDVQREERRRELQARLEARRAARDADPAVDGSDSPLIDDGPATLREAMQDPEAAARMGRALLHRGEDGQFDGFRLSAIRRGSLGDRLGLKNGDIVHEIDGVPLVSLQAAMEAYAKSAAKERIQVQITRRGEPVTLQIPMDGTPGAD